MNTTSLDALPLATYSAYGILKGTMVLQQDDLRQVREAVLSALGDRANGHIENTERLVQQMQAIVHDVAGRFNRVDGRLEAIEHRLMQLDAMRHDVVQHLEALNTHVQSTQGDVRAVAGALADVRSHMQ